MLMPASAMPRSRSCSFHAKRTYARTTFRPQGGARASTALARVVHSCSAAYRSSRPALHVITPRKRAPISLSAGRDFLCRLASWRRRGSGAEEAGHRAQHRRMIEERPVTAAHDDDPAARAKRGRHERVVGPEDGELPLREPVRVIRGAKRDQPPHPPAVPQLYQVAGHEAAEAMAHDVHFRGTGRETDGFDSLLEAPRQALVVETGRIREAREVPDPAPGEEAPQDEKVGRVAEEAVDEHDRCRMWRGRIEALARQDEPERHRDRERAERRELARERSEGRHVLLSRGVLGSGAWRSQHDGVEEEDPVAAVEVALELFRR